MNQVDEDDGGVDPRMKLRANKGDKLHDLQLLRDLAIINARTVAELGPLPPDGLPVVPRRKPNLPASSPRTPPSADAGPQENETMDFKPIAVAAGMALAACTPTENPSHDGQSPHAVESRKNDSPMQAHKFRLNPNPKQRYDITLTIRDAPGPFGVVGFGAHYYADCWYVIDKFAGALGRPRYSIAPKFKKIDETTYAFTVYLDPLIDEDYYGNGICHWRLNSVSVGLVATENDGDTRFSAHIYLEDVIAKEPVTTYFWKGGYPRDPETSLESPVDFGQTDRHKMAPELVDHDLFAITLTSEEV